MKALAGLKCGMLPLAPAAFLSMVPAAMAQDSELARCLAIEDLRAKVECYDAIARAVEPAQPASAATEEPPPSRAPLLAPAPPPAPAATVAGNAPRAEFGLSPAAREERLPTEERQLDRVTATIASVRNIGAGYWQYTMQDGTVWRLTENRRAFRTPQPGDTVLLRRGSLGGYFLDADKQPAIRIKRLS